MKRSALAISVGCLLVALLPATALAVIVPANLDQHNETHDLSIGAESDVAQTFTAGKTGHLTDVELYWNGSGDITVTLHATAAGLPTGAALATSSVTITSADAWIDFAFGSPATVTSGTMYAIVFNTGAEAAALGSADVYAGGQALINSGSWAPISGEIAIRDFAIRTYVAAPAPTAPPTATSGNSPAAPELPGLLLPVASIGFGAACLLIVARRRTQVR